MSVSEAVVPTSSAASFLRKLCQHWSHKFPVEYDDEHGSIELPKGTCTLDARDTALQVCLRTGDAADQERMEQVVAEHLQRFGYKETLVFDWQRS